jgi:hypothetical protein
MKMNKLNLFESAAQAIPHDQTNWVSIPCHTLFEAVSRAIETTGCYEVSFSGDFGQDEGQKEIGMGNDKYAIVVWPNGTAILTISETDNVRYLKG